MVNMLTGFFSVELGNTCDIPYPILNNLCILEL